MHAPPGRSEPSIEQLQTRHRRVRQGNRAPVKDGAVVAAIGSAMRSLRKQQGLSLRDVSEMTGFSISFLSLVERGKSSLALTSLQKCARALGTDASHFFTIARDGHDPGAAHVCRQPGDVEISTGGERVYHPLGSRAFHRALEPILVTTAPSGVIEPVFAHEGEEFAYVLSGELVFIVGGAEHRLAAGDSIHYQSTVPHSFYNDTDQPAESLWVLTPRLF